MKRVGRIARSTAASFALLLAACSSAPPLEWQANAKGALDAAVTAYLVGDTRVANAQFGVARRELASTGRADQVALAELTRCAVQVASLDVGPCAGFEQLRSDATAAQRAYADYLSGRVQTSEVALLPEPYRALAARDLSGDAATAALKSIDDPLSRLIATGVLFQAVAQIRPPSHSRPTPHRRRDGGGRYWHGWACSWRSRRRRATRRGPSSCGGASRLSRTPNNLVARCSHLAHRSKLSGPARRSTLLDHPQ